ncbi:MAG: methionyl-tRNA formyltransferase [Bacteroidales bacterium]
MIKEDLKIVFFGTPDFAVESLSALHRGGYNIVGVVTMPDKIAGRGHKLIQSPIKQYAVANNLKLLQPTNLKDTEFVAELAALKADLQIVIAFRMLPEVVWNMPKMGTFNLHASLLPRYRGAAPINHAIMNGDSETGVTTFFLKQEIDTGDVIQQRRIPINPTDNVGVIHDRLMELGATMVIETVDAIIAGTVKPLSQDEMCNNDLQLSFAPKIFKETCMIDWNKSAIEVYNHIRGLSPYPAAWTTFIDNNTAKEYATKIFEATHPNDTAMLVTNANAGSTVIRDGKLYIYCNDRALEITSLQLAGKKRITTPEFLRGFKADNLVCQ